MKNIRLWVACVATCAPIHLFAQMNSQSWNVKLEGDDSILLSVPYTLGTHAGRASQIEGQVIKDSDTGKFVRATLKVPLSSIDMGKAEMSCHMTESLGLDYSKSDFPNKHVCDHANSLPAEGPNAVAYPMIEFSLKNLEPKPSEDQGDWKAYVSTGDWSIHGKTKTLGTTLWMKQGLGFMKLKGEQTFSLKSFDVSVKPFLMFVKVSDQVKVTFQVTLKGSGL